jgi:hypothetical protein
VTEITLKQGTGQPTPGDLVQGEVAIDHDALTLWAEKSSNSVVTRVGLQDFLALDGENRMEANLDMNNKNVQNVPLPSDDYDAANKLYVDMSQDWERIDITGYDCVVDQQYMVAINGSNPYVDFPTLGNQVPGKYIVLADATGQWGTPGRHLTINLNGPLQGQNVGQLVLDISSVIVTMMWDGYTWMVYTTMGETPAGNPWTTPDPDKPDEIKFYGLITVADLQMNGRPLYLTEELRALDALTIKHGEEIHKIERFIQDKRAEETNYPVVHEAVYDDVIYARQNGEWVPVPLGGDGGSHDIADMFYWETAERFGTSHEGVASMQFNVAETNRPGYDLMLPSFSLVHQVEFQIAYFKGKHPNTGVEYNPVVKLTHIAPNNDVIKTDTLISNQEFGWGQGFERDEQMFQIQLTRGASKVRIDLLNTDGSPMDTSAEWAGTVYKTLIAANGMYLTTDESQA